MPEELTEENIDTENNRVAFLEQSNATLEKMRARYQSVKELSQMLLLMGGDTIVFDGWGRPIDLMNLLNNGRIVETEDVGMELIGTTGCDCNLGFCWCNTAEFVHEFAHLKPVYAFALNNYSEDGLSFWMEHFIVKDTNTDKYYEATEIDTIEKYFAMDITVEKLLDMEGACFDYDIDE
jgi:hypothetical protein